MVKKYPLIRGVVTAAILLLSTIPAHALRGIDRFDEGVAGDGGTGSTEIELKEEGTLDSFQHEERNVYLAASISDLDVHLSQIHTILDNIKRRNLNLPISNETTDIALGQDLLGSQIASAVGIKHEDLEAAISRAVPDPSVWDGKNSQRVKDMFSIAFDALDKDAISYALDHIDLDKNELMVLGKILAEVSKHSQTHGDDGISELPYATALSTPQAPERKRTRRSRMSRPSASSSEDNIGRSRMSRSSASSSEDNIVVNIFMSSILLVRRLRDKQRKVKIGKSPRELPTSNQTQHTTGSFANCTNVSFKRGTAHPDQTHATLSCETLPYRMPEVPSSDDQILIGVLSEAGGEGPLRRNAIRDTWARHSASVYFIVAGEWSSISSEYEEFKDLIWIDLEESYKGIVMKTLLFMEVSHIFAEQANFKFAFKTDDDSFVNVEFLNKYLRDEANKGKIGDYWGTCHEETSPPYRGAKWKWGISFENYPEEFYPPYCLGAGYAVSDTFLKCAARHIPHIRSMPFEDVAIGLLAERCSVSPRNAENENLVSNFRTPFDEEKKAVEESHSIGIDTLTSPDMEGKICQHRIFDVLDMYQHYERLRNPAKHIDDRGCWRKCRDYRNIILLDHYGSRSLDDQLYIIDHATELAGYLCATVRVPPPHTMLSLNDGTVLDPRSHWGDYIDVRMKRSGTSALQDYETDEFDEDHPHIAFHLDRYFQNGGVRSTIFQNQSSDSTPLPRSSITGANYTDWLRLHFSNDTQGHTGEMKHHLGLLEDLTRAQIGDPLITQGFILEVKQTFSWVDQIPLLAKYFQERYENDSMMSRLKASLKIDSKKTLNTLEMDYESFPFMCKYTRHVPQSASEVADMVFDSLEESHYKTNHFGMLHIQTDFGGGDCDTSLAKLPSFLSCSLKQLEVYGTITILFHSDEVNPCYRQAIASIIEGLGYQFVDLDSLVKSVVSRYGNESGSPHLVNEMFILKVQRELVWHWKMSFRFNRGLDSCSPCEKLYNSWQLDFQPIIAEQHSPNQWSPNFEQIMHTHHVCEGERQMVLAQTHEHIHYDKDAWPAVRSIAPPGSRRSAICACAKCGSTSFFNHLYKVSNGRGWNYTDEPYIQEMSRNRWRRANVKMLAHADNFTHFDSDFASFALVRDPKERLLSAYRSKIACHGADTGDREKIVPELLALLARRQLVRDEDSKRDIDDYVEFAKKVGINPSKAVDGPGLCLSRSEFLQALYQIHEQGNQGIVNQHFLPQHLHCFRNVVPAKWTVVMTAGAPTSGCLVEQTVLGTVSLQTLTSGDCALDQIHGTKKSGRKNLSMEENRMLDFITRDEYAMLGPYLN